MAEKHGEDTASKRTDAAPRGRRGCRLFLLLTWYGLVLAVFVLAVEGVALVVNRRTSDGAAPYLFDRSQWGRQGPTALQAGASGQLSYLDPHLGYARNPSAFEDLPGGYYFSGFVVYGDRKATDTIRIVCLGGSTTDGIDPSCWPSQLHREILRRGYKSVVFNGGTSGYSSNQELLKTLRDALPLEPDVVVSLNGVNDLGFIHSVSKHPMVHPYQYRLLNAVTDSDEPALLPNTMRLLRRWRSAEVDERERIEGRLFGVRVDTTPPEQWARNVRLLDAVCNTEGVAYLCFLQPTLGVGDYEPGPADEKLMQDAREAFGGRYLRWLEEFYGPARATARREPHIVDLVDLFAGRSEIYRDARHPLPEGYGMIARAVADELTSRGLLGAAPSSD